jgi:A/G-specific adenine glycosylase
MLCSEPSRAVAAREALLGWYAPRRNAYPWRRGRLTAYRVLVSEIMLQQTQVARVVPAYRGFLRRFPSVRALAAATPAEVLRAWAGLGYNRRAVALSEAARAIVRLHGGRVPRDPTVLRSLPGVGPYTAAAVASIAFGRPVAAVDTNVRRIVARALGGCEPDAVAPAELVRGAQGLLDIHDPAAWNQGLMDLGREVCRPIPRCEVCPLAGWCRFRAAGRRPRPSRPMRPAFEGSMRQVRGSVVRVLRERDSLTPTVVARSTGEPIQRVRRALDGLVRDGVVELAPAGRFRLPAGMPR